MKKILVTVVLGVAVLAGAQSAQPAQSQPAAQPAQAQPAAPQSTAPVIKDPAEYNAYVAAIGQTDPNAKISALEAFLTQYPSSIMKNQALEVLMGAYQASNNIKKTMDAATRLMLSGSTTSGSITTNSSPPMRATVSPVRTQSPRRSEIFDRITSPMWWR